MWQYPGCYNTRRVERNLHETVCRQMQINQLLESLCNTRQETLIRALLLQAHTITVISSIITKYFH